MVAPSAALALPVTVRTARTLEGTSGRGVRASSRLRPSAREGRCEISWNDEPRRPPGEGRQQPPPPGSGPSGYPPPPPPGQPQYYPGYGPPPKQGTNGLAIASLVLGIVWIWGVTSVLAIIFGLIARRQIKERNESGDGMAIAGIVLGILGVVGAIALIVIFAAFVDEIDELERYEDFEMIGGAAAFAAEKASSAAATAKGLLAGLL
ncbi:MAG TPA: DUF4190 domain-containing protein [Acidimicrobiales bacterium]|nr:DUF4190 domain-containing protein [Acidimicrobiales bacterium]